MNPKNSFLYSNTRLYNVQSVQDFYTNTLTRHLNTLAVILVKGTEWRTFQTKYLFNLIMLLERKIRPNKNYSITIVLHCYCQIFLQKTESIEKKSFIPPGTIFDLKTFLNDDLKTLKQFQTQLKMWLREADNDHYRPRCLQTPG